MYLSQRLGGAVTACSLAGYLASERAPGRIVLCPAGLSLERDIDFLRAARVDTLWHPPDAIVLDAIAAQRPRVILYHIPSVTMVGLSQDLIDRLKTGYAGIVVGVKDSSGDWDYAQELLARHRDLAILIGDERRLAEAVRMGAQGAISGLANLAPELLLPLAEAGRDDPRVTQIVDDILRYPVVPAVKELCAHLTGDSAWRAVAPPLEPLDRTQATALCAAFDAAMRSRRS